MRSTSAAGGSIAPTVQFENLAIHTVLRRLSNFHLGQYLSPSALVDLMIGRLESKQRSQLRGGVDRKAFLFVVTSLSCGSPTLSHPPLRTPPGPRLYLGWRSGERDGVQWNQRGDCQKVNCPAGAREATLGCAALRLAMTARPIRQTAI